MIAVGTITSLASLAVSIASAFIAKSALAQAKLAVQEQTRSVQEQKLANEQAHTDWAQRKWFDLYFKVEQAYNALEKYQVTCQHSNPATMSAQQQSDANEVALLFREAGAVALVFPKNNAVDKLLETAKFPNLFDMVQPSRLKAISDAVELLRQNALVDKHVLDVLTSA
jgi:Tfp pilus assembly protein PilE